MALRIALLSNDRPTIFPLSINFIPSANKAARGEKTIKSTSELKS